MSNLPSPESPLFIISPEMKAKYEAQFKKLCPTGDYLSGDQVKGIMLQSGLPPMVLAAVWSLADVDADGRMDINEFSIALHLIALKLKGVEVPRTLPQSLKILVEPPPAFAAFGNEKPINTPASMKTTSPLVSSNSISPSTSVTSKMSSSGQPSNVEWAIPQQSKLKYTQIFNSHDRSRTGFLTGVQARNILMESKLPQVKLAQVWNLADVDADGRLTCEEFVLAMHLIDRARMNEVLPTKLSLDLVPPSYRRTSTSGTLSHTSSVEDNPPEMSDLGGLSKSSFEDKRRENFEKGQAELDRRRAAMAEQQKREREERERKEREENMRKEKERQEVERKKQEELERAQQRLREQELEKEEAKRRTMEVRELARKEMERQRQRELEQSRRNELINQRSRLQEEVLKLKSRRKALTIEHEQMNKRIVEGKAAATASREKVVRVKSEIDGMRIKRDATMAKQASIKEQMKSFTEKNLFIEQEKVKLSTQLKTLFANASNGFNTDQQLTSFTAMLQAKQLAINQLRAHLERYEQEYKSKKKDVINGKRELEELKRRFESKRIEAKSFNQMIESKRVEAEMVRDSGVSGVDRMSNATTTAPPFSSNEVEVMSVPKIDWPVSNTTTTSFTPTTTQTKFKYRCIYEFEARNKDEITIRPGDIILVDTSACSEPDWLSGEINGQIGWFPQGYAELIPEEGDVSNRNDAFGSSAPISTATASDKTATLKHATPLYDWEATEQGHLSLSIGKLIRITDQHDTWYYGEIADTDGKVISSGWFPDNYVQILTDSEVASFSQSNVNAADGSSSDQYYVGLYAYESTEKGDLEFNVDELILVEKKEGDWWTGVIVDRFNGKLVETRRGIFPSNFVGPARASDIPVTATKTDNNVTTAQPTTTVTSKAPSTETKAHQLLDRKTSEATESPKPKKSKAKKVEIVTATHAYVGSGPEQLSLEVGQLIQVRKKMDSGWWEGELQAKGKKKQIGWFPASYVKPLGGGVTAGGSAGSSARSTPDPAVKSATEEPEIERVTAFYAFKAEREDEISIEPNDVIRVLSKPDTTWWRGHNIRTGAIGLFPSNHVQSASNKVTESSASQN